MQLTEEDKRRGGGRPPRGPAKPTQLKPASLRPASLKTTAPKAAMPSGAPKAAKPAKAPTMPVQPVRLQKILAQSGIGSRRRCEELISSGRVKVNGTVVHELGARALPGVDRVELDGVNIGAGERVVHYLLYKPVGYVSTAADPEGRRTVLDLVPREQRVYPVGRLDYDSEGLLIVSNDGHLTNLLTHPSHEVGKTYLALVSGVPQSGAIAQLRKGVMLEDGLTAPARVKLVRTEGENAWVEVTIHEGRNRQVRRMCDAVGHPVLRLMRTRLAFLTLEGLTPGQWRPLTDDEVQRLEAEAQGETVYPGQQGKK